MTLICLTITLLVACCTNSVIEFFYNLVLLFHYELSTILYFLHFFCLVFRLNKHGTIYATYSKVKSSMGQSPLVWRWSPIQGPQPDTSWSCKTTDMGPVCRVVACLPPSFCRYQFILLGDRGTWVWTTCPELLPDSDMTGNRSHDHLIYRYITKPRTVALTKCGS